MKNFSTKYLIEGTSALKFNSLDETAHNSTIVSFPQTSNVCYSRKCVTHRSARQSKIRSSRVRCDNHMNHAGDSNRASSNNASSNNAHSSISGIPFNRMTRLQVVVSSIVLGAITYVGFFMPF